MNIFINPDVETVLQENIFPDLEKGRKGFDLNHTQAVVFWMKELLKSINDVSLDVQVLVTAAYAHDWGYTNLFDDQEYRSLEEINKRKPMHMELGAEKIEKLLQEKLPTFFSHDQILQTKHLVFMHDKVEELVTQEEILLMEADTLGMLDSDKVKPTFSKADNDIFMQEQIQDRRLPHFIHPEAKKLATIMVQKRLKFYEIT